MRTMNASDSLGRRRISADLWDTDQALPAELGKYLKRINTRDIMHSLDKHGMAEDEIHSVSVQASALWLLSLPFFESAMGVVILANLIVMIIDTDRSTTVDSSETSIFWTDIFGNVVLLVFVIELTMRLVAYRWLFFFDRWNWFDAVIVVVDTIFSIIGFLAGNTFPVSILRIFRLAKIVRIFKVLRVFPELRLLLAGLLSAMTAIFWGTCLLLFCLLVWAMVGVLFIHPLTESIDFDDCERCRRAYSSVFQATLTLWSSIVTGDGWGRVPIPVVEKYPASAVYFISVYLTVGMAVTNLILGVVVNVAQRAQDSLGEADNAERILDKIIRHTQLIQLCKAMDNDGDGSLSHDEVFQAFDAEGEFAETIAAFDITRDEFNIIWTIIDSEKKGYVSYKELVSFVTSMKTTDTQFMLSYVKYYITLLKDEILGKMKDVEQKQEKQLMRQEALSLRFNAKDSIMGFETASSPSSTLKSDHVRDSLGRASRGVVSEYSACTESTDTRKVRFEGDVQERRELFSTSVDDFEKFSSLATDWDVHGKACYIEGRDAALESIILNERETLLSSVVPKESSRSHAALGSIILNEKDSLLSSVVPEEISTMPILQEKDAMTVVPGARSAISGDCNTNPRKMALSTNRNAMSTAVAHLRKDISKWQSELQSVLSDMEDKIDCQLSYISAVDPNLMTTSSTVDIDCVDRGRIFSVDIDSLAREAQPDNKILYAHPPLAEPNVMESWF